MQKKIFLSHGDITLFREILFKISLNEKNISFKGMFSTGDKRLPSFNQTDTFTLYDFIKNKKKYLYINSKKKKIPFGLSVELFNLGEIRKIKNKNKNDLEHVTWSIKKENNEFPIESNLEYKEKASIDTLYDYLLIKNFFEKANIKTNTHWRSLIKKFHKFCISYNLGKIKKQAYER